MHGLNRLPPAIAGPLFSLAFIAEFLIGRFRFLFFILA
jgi:hypothetical protein